MPASAAPASSMNFFDLSGDAQQQSHDETCLDHCMGIAMFNGSRLYHRGGPSHLLARSRPSLPQYPYSSHQISPFPNPPTLQAALYHHRSAPHAGQQQVPSPHAGILQGTGGQQAFHRPRTSVFPGLDFGENENLSAKSCCDSDCEMPDKCSDAACEDTDTACNDQNCPERPTPLDVANGAAALISINHAQAPNAMPPDELPPHSYASTLSSSRRQSLVGLSMNDAMLMVDTSHQSAYQAVGSFDHQPWNMQDITVHVLRDHGKDSSTGCTGPCLVDSLPDFSTCHLPSLEDYPIFDPFAADSHYPTTEAFTECGIKIPTGEAFVHHFNEYHRQQLVADHNDSFSPCSPHTSETKLMVSAGLMPSPVPSARTMPQSSPLGRSFSPFQCIERRWKDEL